MPDARPFSATRGSVDGIAGVSTAGGLTLLGPDHTAHGEASMSALSARADGVLWVAEPSDGVLEFEYERERDHAVGGSR